LQKPKKMFTRLAEKERVTKKEENKEKIGI
jgi:hypothetical protein